MQEAKNIIFDMGGVFLNIDYKKTEQAFIDLGVEKFVQFFKQDYSSHLFEDLETGEIDVPHFYAEFRRETQKNLSDEVIKKAWNAMLGNFPPERLKWLKEIKNKYNVYLYSNTNQIHYDFIMETFRRENGQPNFNDYFKKAYYSHEVHLRKPVTSSYTKLLALAGLVAEETLFIDDTLNNVEGAAAAGMQTIYLKPPMTVLDLKL